MIVDKIAPDDPGEAFEVLWQFMDLGQSIYARADDRRGDISEVFSATIQYFEVIAPRAEPDIETLADRVWTALRDDDQGVWDDIIGLLATTLGDSGFDRLKAHIEDFAATPIARTDADHEAIQFLRDLRGDPDDRADLNTRFVKRCLQDIAEVTGVTSAYIAQFTANDLAANPSPPKSQR